MPTDFLAGLLAPYRAAAQGQEMDPNDPLYSLILHPPVPQQTNQVNVSNPSQASSPGSLQALVQHMAKKRYGWTGGEWDALSSLINAESGWDPNVSNPSSSAYGLGQFLDSTYENYGITHDSPIKQQAGALLQYVSDRYGDPTTAWSGWGGSNLGGPKGY